MISFKEGREIMENLNLSFLDRIFAFFVPCGLTFDCVVDCFNDIFTLIIGIMSIIYLGFRIRIAYKENKAKK